MPRRARITYPGVPVHLIQRGNNRQPCFFTDVDYRCYLDWLTEYAQITDCDVHAFVLMTNHVHLLVTPQRHDSLSRLMKRLGQRYVQYVNRTYRRSGTLWEGRYRSCVAQEEVYVLACYRYIELNPVRANMVDHPADYPWSSYRANGQGEPSDLLAPHSLYQALASEDDSRRAHYRALFETHLEPGLIEQIRSATNGGFVLGDERFQNQVAAVLQRRVVRGEPGRPPRQAMLENGDMFE